MSDISSGHWKTSVTATRNWWENWRYRDISLLNGKQTLVKSQLWDPAHTSFLWFWDKYIRTSAGSQWPRGLRRRSKAVRPLRLCFRIPPEAWMFICCECCVLSGWGLCDGLITRPEDSCRLWRVVMCDQETSKTRRLKPATGLWKYNHNVL